LFHGGKMEIEKKFIPDKLPDNLNGYSFREMLQGYLNTDPAVRIRRENDEYYLTCKGKGLMAREEYNFPLTKEAFDHLLPKCDGRLIRKTRYLIPMKDTSGLTAELDIFHEDLSGLIMLEVEFKTLEEAESFQAPTWFGKDVTEDPRFKNSSLSKGGPVPHV